LKTRSKLTYSLTLLFLALFLNRCANPVSPSGGPTDTSPPQFLGAEPPLFTKNFKSDRIRIYFDEFLELKDISNQLIISPPMEKMPEIKLKGKSVVVEFQEPLHENTTYNIFFGEAVTDLTENNPVSNFKYIFSTGDVLDSLTMEGKVLNAFNLEPTEGVNVMLYLDINDTIDFDSVPYFVRPYYLTRTDKDGRFVLYNLKDEAYKIFALLDANSNLIYDQPNENIAFIDSLVRPWFVKSYSEPDSLTTDSLSSSLYETDTAKHEAFSMLLFDETDSIQKLNKAWLAAKNKIQFVFKIPTLSPTINPLNISTDQLPSIVETNKARDTLTLWLLGIPADTITFELRDDGEIIDTVEIATVKKQGGKKARKKEVKPERPDIKFGLKGNVIQPDIPLRINFNYPLETLDSSGILLVESEDTLKPEIYFKDSVRRTAILDHKWKMATDYKLIIPDSAITDILGRCNDSIIERFRTKATEDYGNFNISLNLENPGDFHIMQWLDKDEKIIQEFLITSDTTIHLTNEEPGGYFLKVVYDKNKNRKWDSGNHINNIQPEIVIYFQKQIEIRANWDIEEEWGI
jgi:hypothetical protein